jgi:hypothetical protein
VLDTRIASPTSSGDGFEEIMRDLARRQQGV